jgi:hypothetical protein
MASKELGGRAGIFRPWDGKLTGPQPGEPGPVADRNQTWGSVQQKQSGRMFSTAEVRKIIADIITAVKSGKDINVDDVVSEEKTEKKDEEFVIGGK